ncbi:hypothetical protein O3P69_001674 [Scylla paramamosain]|uniref:Uncharacterized protein n=1 Tax=Scylla paramamosain TaxID=85552 RepID=A0AAW0V196_SCYPA
MYVMKNQSIFFSVDLVSTRITGLIVGQTALEHPFEKSKVKILKTVLVAGRATFIWIAWEMCQLILTELVRVLKKWSRRRKLKN